LIATRYQRIICVNLRHLRFGFFKIHFRESPPMTSFKWLSVLLAFAMMPLHGNVRLPALLADHMVLQQQSQAVLWGDAKPGERICINAGWQKQSMVATADPKGRWQASIPTPTAGGPYSITFQGENTVTLKDVMIGEVWVCSGQSNMEWTMETAGGWKTFPEERARLGAEGDANLRLCTIPKTLSAKPLDHCRTSWSRATADSVPPFSVVAYFYGRELQRRLNVPVGLICAAWSGTFAEAWTPRPWLTKDPELVSTLHDPGGNEPNRPSVLYNAMIHPLLPLRMRGVIWYQGESNTANADLYGRLFPALIQSWRAAWKQGDFPFYFVQIAPYLYPDEPPTSAYVRDAQRRALALPNTGMAVTLDLADPTDLHPKTKPDIAHRLALWALSNTYHQNVGAFSGPLLRETSVEGGQIRLRFDHTEGGLKARSGSLRGFEIAPKGGAFVEAEARIDGDTVVVSQASVPHPAEVRYAFSHAPEASLFNGAGLPASPFQTEPRPLLLRHVSCKATWDATKKSARATFTCDDPRGRIHLSTDGRDPGPSDQTYTAPLTFRTATHLRARAFLNGQGSEFIQDLRFTPHLALGRKAALAHPPSAHYPGHPGSLTDGFEGSEDFTDGRWLGFEGDDADITLNLGHVETVGSASIVFLDDPANWIFAPTSIDVALSVDGRTFTPSAHLEVLGRSGLPKPLVRTVTPPIAPARARYLRLKVKNLGLCPPGHAGAGEKAWLFLSEVKVETPRANPQMETSKR
jgi:sialate O-acetylesterase